MDIDINCPECGVEFTVTLREVAANGTKSCPRGHRVKLEDQGGGAREAQEAMDDLDRALRNLGRGR